MTTHLTRLFDHLDWADARVLASLRRSAAPPAESLNVYAHIIAAEHVWLARIGGLQQRVVVWPELSLDECADLSAKNTQGFRMILRSASSSRLAEAITYRNSAGAEFTSALDDILLHVALHGMYHRGQIATSLRKSGSVPIPTDYIAFVREGLRPLPVKGAHQTEVAATMCSTVLWVATGSKLKHVWKTVPIS